MPRPPPPAATSRPPARGFPSKASAAARDPGAKPVPARPCARKSRLRRPHRRRPSGARCTMHGGGEDHPSSCIGAVRRGVAV